MTADEVQAAIVKLTAETRAVLPPGRESSLVLTKLDEAAFWAAAAHKAATGMGIHE